MPSGWIAGSARDFCVPPLALVARVFVGERLMPVAWCGLITALLGTIIVAVQKSDIKADSNLLVGNVIVLLAALTWSAGTVYSRKLLPLISPMQLSASGAVIALPIHIVLAASVFRGSVSELQSGTTRLIILYAGVLSSGLALPMWNFGVRQAGAAHAAVIQNLIPLVAIVAAWLLRGESATVPQMLGGLLIITGLVVMRLNRKTPLAAPVSAGRSADG